MYSPPAIAIFTVTAVMGGLIPNAPENTALIAPDFDEPTTQFEAERIGKFEGDMILSADQQAAILADIQPITGERNLALRWSNRIVPYAFTNDLSGQQRFAVQQAMRTIEAAAPCLRFVPRVRQVDYVLVQGHGNGCWSYVGRQGGRQLLNLQLNGCFYPQTIVHEFLHALGFFHMQSSYRRDDYVRIAWEHIVPEMKHNFIKYTSDSITNFGHAYDIQSIMHYSAYMFSKDGHPTIIPHDLSQMFKMGFAPTMSTLDIKRLNAMYCNA